MRGNIEESFWEREDREWWKENGLFHVEQSVECKCRKLCDLWNEQYVLYEVFL